ncbi:MAG TPA: MlaD family protein, partial [Nitrospira sp.]
MAHQPADIDIDALQEVLHERKKRKSLPFVWIVPLIAAIIGGWLVVKGILEKGPTITIHFTSAEGLEAGKTKVKYRSVDVGEVKQIKVSEDLLGVVATVEMVKAVDPYLVEDTQFWIVRPRIAGGQVSGLGTLFSGSYIGSDPGKSRTKRRDFVGLEVPPIITTGMAGHHFALHAETLGSLQVGSPVLFREEEVGSIVAHEINKDGQGVTFIIFVNAPYDQYVNVNSRFWNTSGIDVTMDANGIRVDTESLASILIGGLAFETFPGMGPQSPAGEKQDFTLFKNRSEAMKRPDSMSFP